MFKNILSLIQVQMLMMLLS